MVATWHGQAALCRSFQPQRRRFTVGFPSRDQAMRLAVERSSTQGQQPVLIRVSDVGWGAFAMAVRSVSLVS